MKKDDSIYVEHILDAIQKIVKYADGHSKESFLKSDMTQDAIIRQLEIIGEATKQISSELRNEYHDIPWSDMAGMRDVLIHNYFGVDLWAVWRTVEVDIPELKRLLTTIEFTP